VTCESGSNAMKHFENIGAHIIPIRSEPVILSSMIDYYLSRPSFIVKRLLLNIDYRWMKLIEKRLLPF
jgi:hypothetical protein